MTETRELTAAEAACINRDLEEAVVTAGQVVDVEQIDGVPHCRLRGVLFRLGWEADADLEQRRQEEADAAAAIAAAAEPAAEPTDSTLN